MDKAQIIKASTTNIDIISVYRSSGHEDSEEFIHQITQLNSTEKTTVICGDLNINYLKDPMNKVGAELINRGFRQIVKEPTHKEGSLLDHLYFHTPKEDFEITDIFQHPLYFSDHDAICVQVKYVQN